MVRENWVTTNSFETFTKIFFSNNSWQYLTFSGVTLLFGHALFTKISYASVKESVELSRQHCSNLHQEITIKMLGVIWWFSLYNFAQLAHSWSASLPPRFCVMTLQTFISLMTSFQIKGEGKEKNSRLTQCDGFFILPYTFLKDPQQYFKPWKLSG